MSRSSDTLTLSTKRHIDQICLRFEAAWQQSPRPPVEQYLEEVTEPELSALLTELLLVELDYRLRAGEAPAAGEYCGRFPGHARLVERVFRKCGLARAASGKRVGYFGDYELLEEIARGGMGIVYKARQVSLDRIVALKMIRAGRLASPEDVERFHQEARVAAGLQHPNIVAIHEVGEHEEQHFFSMDYVDGTSLGEIVRESPLPARRAALYLKTMAEAVHYAHQRGNLHRDLKPANVIIDTSDQPRITDFGLARRIEAASDLTASGQVLGTPSYMSPEQATGDLAVIGAPSDVYGLGATLYELLTGRPPFRTDTALITLRHVIELEPVPPRQLNPAVPRDLDVICLRCLEKEPKRRYPSAQELADDLGRFLVGEPIRARPVGALSRLARWCRRKPLVAALAGSALALLLLLAGGASLAALLLTHERNATLRAKQDATEKLWESYLAQARARRWSGRPGRRFDSLEALAAAAAIRPTLELRNEAIACLALPDLRVAKEWQGLPPDAHGLAFDGRLERYAVGDAQGNLSLRDVADNREIMRLHGPGNPAWVLRFSPGGGYLAAKYHPPEENDVNHVWVWDLARGETRLKTEHPVLNVALAFSSDDRWLAAGRLDGSISLYDLATAEEIRRFPPQASVGHLRFHPNETQLAAGTFDGRVFIYDAESGRTLHVISVGHGLCRTAWHPTGRLLAVACDDPGIHFYDADSGQRRTILDGPAGELAFSHGGDLLAGAAGDLSVRLWHLPDHSPLVTLPGSVLIGPPVFSPDDKLLGHRVDGGMVSLLEVAVAPECRTLVVAPFSDQRLWDTAISPDGRLLAAAYDDGVNLWDLARGDQVARLPRNDGRSVEFTRDPPGLIAMGSFGVWQWPMRNEASNKPALPMGPGERISLPEATALERCEWNHDDHTIVAALPDAAVVVDVRTHQERVRFGGHQRLSKAVLSPDGRWLACGTWHGSGAKVLDTRQGKIVLSVPETDNSHVAFSPDGTWLVTSTGPEYRLWSVGSWKPGLRIARSGTNDVPGPMAFTPDGSILALVPSWPLVQLIEVASGRELATLEAPDVQDWIVTLSFTPDGASLVAGNLSRQLHVWDLRLVRRQLTAMGLDWDEGS